MSINLMAELRAEADAYIAHLTATLQASTQRIELAEDLARRLSSCGVAALPYARLDAGMVLVWVVATAKSTEQLDAALTKLDLQECSSTPGQYAYEIRLKGHDFPIYIYTPAVEAHLLTQINTPHHSADAHA